MRVSAVRGDLCVSLPSVALSRQQLEHLAVPLVSSLAQAGVLVRSSLLSASEDWSWAWLVKGGAEQLPPGAGLGPRAPSLCLLPAVSPVLLAGTARPGVTPQLLASSLRVFRQR